MILPMGKLYFPHSFYSCFRGFVQANYSALPQRVLTLGLFCALQRRIIRYSLSEISNNEYLCVKDGEEQLVLWRAAWANAVNLCLEHSGHEERVDHRSHAERGLDEQPTIHKGGVSPELEKKGIISDRCELNRQIKADNTLLREPKSLVKKLMDAVKNTVPVLAEAMEAVRQKMIVFRYQLLHIGAGKKQITGTLQAVQPDIQQYDDIVKQHIASIESSLEALNQQEKKYTAELHTALAQYTELRQEAAARVPKMSPQGDGQ